jgi:hypothetical protein
VWRWKRISSRLEKAAAPASTDLITAIPSSCRLKQQFSRSCFQVTRWSIRC